jgi:hypothetical protein
VLGDVGGDGLMRHPLALALTVMLACAGCSELNNYEDDSEGFIEHVEERRIGSDADYWVEILNMSGEWEKTVLVFGYTDDFAECQTVAAGLKKVNFAREYRCKPANRE